MVVCCVRYKPLPSPRALTPHPARQALDDPIAPKEATPFEALRAQPLATTVTTLTGGHLGWVEARTGATGAPWSNAVMFEWLSAVVEEVGGGKQQQQQKQQEAEELVRKTEEVAAVVARVGA